MPGVRARIMRRERLIALGIFDQRLCGFGNEADQLGLYALEPGFQLRVDRFVPRWIDRINFSQNIDAFAG